MGSFNEVCALSSLNISPGTKVRLLFLTQNPYEKSRSCYSTDQWFVRCPPIKGVYDDYGRCKFKESPITDLISEVFEKDVIERPFGFNQYHEGDVTKGKGIYHFLHAAYQGRLLVQDEYLRPKTQLPVHFPTWQKIHTIFREKKLPIQSDSKKDEGCAGYNAQPVSRGIVCVDFNSYNDNTKKLKKAQSILEIEYDCRLVKKFKDRDNEVCLMVAPKGAFDNPSILNDEEETKKLLSTHPQIKNLQDNRKLRVLSVVVREDVWQAYCDIAVDGKYSFFDDRSKTVEEFNTELKEICDKYHEESKKEFFMIGELGFRNILFHLPFMTTPSVHIVSALEKGDFKAMDDLLMSCAELARVEFVMNSLWHSWFIPSFGGQYGEWALRTALLSKITEISQKELDREISESEEG